MGFVLDRSSKLTFATQVQHQTMAQLVAGRLHPGDRLPSVRQLARQLRISRTTAERINDALCESMLADVRPRSGAFVATPELTQLGEIEWVHSVHDFLKETIHRADRLGLNAKRLAELLGVMDRDNLGPLGKSAVWIPVVITKDTFDCMVHCLGDSFPARLRHLPPTARDPQATRGAPFVLSGYYSRERAARIAEATGCSLVYIRYNTQLLDKAMAIPAKEERYVVTRDADNAQALAAFFRCAYPEVPSQRYSVVPVDDWLKDARATAGTGQVWVTTTARGKLRGRVASKRVRVLHPLLAEEFIEELRYLTLRSLPPWNSGWNRDA